MRIFWWLLITLWCSLIFLQSNNNAEVSSHESTVIVNVVNNMAKSVTGLEKPLISEKFIRKSAHFTEYFILGCFLMQGFKSNRKLLPTVLMTIGFGTLYSISDEIHQYFIPGRSPRLLDVLIDCSGLSLGAFVIFILRKRKIE